MQGRLHSRAWGFRVPSNVFKIVLIKPSHYDEDGYVIQWWRSLVPSNSLASVHGLLSECNTEKALGPDIDIDVEAYDECNTVISVKKTIRAIRAAGAGFVGLVGVQSNQFPRALDLARQFRAADIPVVLGGFHVSGCLSMLPELPADLKEAIDLGVILYAGEGEGRMGDLLRDMHSDLDASLMKVMLEFILQPPGICVSGRSAVCKISWRVHLFKGEHPN